MGRKARKGFSSGLVPGKVINVYINPMLEEEHLGKIQLTKLVTPASNMEAFITEDMASLRQEVHSLEEWEGLVVESTPLGETYNFRVGETVKRKVKMLFSVGMTPSGVKSLRHISNELAPIPLHLIDNFEGVPGWGQQF